MRSTKKPVLLMKANSPSLLRFSLLKLNSLILLGVFICLFSWQAAPVRGEETFKTITGPCNFQFPQDHGPHLGYRTEWWYYTGNLHSENGEPFGFQLTFFRSQMSPPGADRKWPKFHSAWRTQQLFLAHAAVSDIQSQRFFHAEQMARGALEFGGAQQDSERVFVFLKNWSASITSEKHMLFADTDDFNIDLELSPQKPPAVHGDAGYSLKGRKPESASCYYSMTRLKAEGSLFIKGKKVTVKGLAWMDHEYSSAPLESDLVGWDWFSLQLDNGTELMIYLLRKNNGDYSAASSGTLIEPSGLTRHLSKEMFKVETLEQWKSPHSQAVYPAQWRIEIQPLGIDLTIVANIADQEMRTPETTRVTYWEGSVRVECALRGEKLGGVGYVELTGYANAFDAPM